MKKLILFLTLSIFYCMTYAGGPTLVSPKNDTVNIPTKFFYTFSHTGGMIYYDIELDTSALFNSSMNILKTGVNDFSGFPDGFVVMDSVNSLFFDTHYYWRVKGRNNTDTTEWSEIRSLTTDNKPKLASPIDGYICLAPTQIAVVKNSMGDTKIIVEWDKSPIFNSPIYQVQVLNITGSSNYYSHNHAIVIGLTGLNNTETYYWRAKAYNDVDSSDWSDLKYFVTNFSNSEIEMHSPEEISFYPNPANDLLIIRSQSAKGDIGVYDLTGKKIVSHQITSESETMDISGIPQGIYFIHSINSEQQINIYKLIITK